jgi:hypothetical protein
MLAAITRKFRHPPPATPLLHAMTTSSLRQPNADAALFERRVDGLRAAGRPLALAQPPIPHAANRSLGLPPIAPAAVLAGALRHRVADGEHVTRLRREPGGIDAGFLPSDSRSTATGRFVRTQRSISWLFATLMTSASSWRGGYFGPSLLHHAPGSDNQHLLSAQWVA